MESFYVCAQPWSHTPNSQIGCGSENIIRFSLITLVITFQFQFHCSLLAKFAEEVDHCETAWFW